jgi:hypothetical protein
MASNLMHKFAATIAAYAIALQAVLAGFAIAAPVASADAGLVICRGDDTGAPAMPRMHDSCGACLAGDCAGAAAVPGRVTITAPWPVGVIRAEIPLHAATRAPATRYGEAHSPRAPPRA